LVLIRGQRLQVVAEHLAARLLDLTAEERATAAGDIERLGAGS
jgi:hypothetical protein